MNSLLWQLRQWGRRLGIVGLLGIALLLLALGLIFSLVNPLEQQTRQQQQQLDLLRAAAQSAPAEPLVATPAAVAMLPPDSSAASVVGELERLAQAHGFELTRGQYSIAAVNGVPLARWQMVFQVQAGYPDLHAFIAAALERMPNLVLDEIKLKREEIENVDLQTELRFGLFVETAP